MRTRNILIATAIIFFVLNGMGYISGRKGIPDVGSVNKTAYLVGFNLLFIIGFVFLIIAYFIHRKVMRKRRNDMIDSFLK